MLDYIDEAKRILKSNDLGKWTRPTAGLYPHQWLWDSCFTAIGLATYDTERAASEIHSILKGQWKNGMVPHMIMEKKSSYKYGADFWQSFRSPDAPKNLHTSGITQPPLLAEACWQISRHQKTTEAKQFLKTVYPKILAYHQWLYRERDFDNSGIVALYHPWETGIDNAPRWMEELKKVHMPFYISLIEKLKLDKILGPIVRKDTRYVTAEERITTTDAMRLGHVALALRKRNYNNERILRTPHFVIESLSFNCILIANNKRLLDIADFIGEKVPNELIIRFEKAEIALEELWQEKLGQYCHRNHLTGEMVPVSGIAMLLPLYAGCITTERAKYLVGILKDQKKFWLEYPVPSVPADSKSFQPKRYWQGPTWINTNWLVIEGLKKYGYKAEAEKIRQSSIALVEKSGFREYFSPLDGSGAGSQEFSWTAALYLELRDRGNIK